LDLLLGFVEEHSLCCGGGIVPEGFSFFIECGLLSEASERHELLKKFLMENDFICNVNVGELVDANSSEPVPQRKLGLLKDKGPVTFADDFAMSAKEIL